MSKVRINSLNIQNYRSFKDSKIIEFPNIKKPISIVGANNSGKSNILRAIEIISGKKWISDTIFKEADFYQNDLNNEIKLTAEIEGDGNKEAPDGIFNKCVIGKLNEAEIVECSETGQKNYNKMDNVQAYFIEFDKIKEQLKIRGEYGALTIFGKKIQEIKKKFNSEDIKTKDGVTTTRNKVFNSLAIPLIHDILTKENKTYNAFEHKVKEALCNLLNCEGLDITLSNFDYSILFNNLEFQLKLGEKDSEFIVPIKNTGNGFIALFVISMFQSLLSDDGCLFIIDEPETYLHENYQKHFYKLLNIIAEKNQVIIATHSKNFVDIFEPSSIVKVTNEKFDESVITQTRKILDEEQIEISLGKTLKYPQEYGLFINSIEPNLNNIPFSNKVIICEGCHDKLGYSLVLDNYLAKKNSSLELENISIIAAIGKPTVGHLAKLCTYFEIPCFIIHDSDLDTKFTFNNDLDELSSNHQDYLTLSSSDKGAYTNNWNIYKVLKNESLIHRNERDVETTLGIMKSEKSAFSIFEKINSIDSETIMKNYPNFLPQKIIDFVDSKINIASILPNLPF